MRLVDQIAASRQPLRVQQSDGQVWNLTGAALAYSDGTTLGQCLDLVHLAAEHFWVEWRDQPRRREFARTFPHLQPECSIADGLRAGAFFSADRSGIRGSVRSFCVTDDTASDPQVSPLITKFDFDARSHSLAGRMRCSTAPPCWPRNPPTIGARRVSTMFAVTWYAAQTWFFGARRIGAALCGWGAFDHARWSPQQGAQSPEGCR